MNQMTIAGKYSFASLLHDKRLREGTIDPQWVDVTLQPKRKQHI